MAPAHSRSPRSAHPAVSIVHYSYAHPAASIFMRFGGDTHIYPPHYCILEWHPGDWKCRIARIFSKNNRRKSWFPLCRYERKLPSENIPGFISTVSLIFIFLVQIVGTPFFLIYSTHCYIFFEEPGASIEQNFEYEGFHTRRRNTSLRPRFTPTRFYIYKKY